MVSTVMNQQPARGLLVHKRRRRTCTLAGLNWQMLQWMLTCVGYQAAFKLRNSQLQVPELLSTNFVLRSHPADHPLFTYLSDPVPA